jgi:2-succinyl-6-hydroxy-2,4-cyclohexadiene-1-carboxylate synthase
MQRPKSVLVNGLQVAYDEAGSGGRPFVLVHGFTGSRVDFAEQMPALAERGRTLAPDLRGHGASGRGAESEYSFDQLARDVLGFLDAVGVERCDLLGHSMGGMVALRIVLAHPERVASLVLMDTAAAPLALPGLSFLDAAAKIAREQGMEQLYAISRQFNEADPNRPAAIRKHLERVGADKYWAWVRDKMLAMDAHAFAALGPELARTEALLPRLGEIRCATLVMVGAEDVPFLKPAELMTAAIPGARQITIPDAAHQPQLENPEAWLAAIVDHLDRARQGTFFEKSRNSPTGS